MFKSFAVTVCRVFITQQKIITPLNAETYLCDICVFLTAPATGSLFCFMGIYACVCVCVCVCFYYIFDALQTTPLFEIP